nr:Rab9 effector protein with kelch motifs-like [Tanacetum cinerariifolium]
MLVRQVCKRKTSTPKSSPSSQHDSPPLSPIVYFQSPSPPSYNPLRDEMINQLHNISTILDSHTDPSNAYIYVPSSPSPQPVHPPSHAQVEFHSSFFHCTMVWKRVATIGIPPTKRNSQICVSWKNKIIDIGGEDT